MKNSKIPLWMKGCRIAQFKDRAGIYTTYIQLRSHFISMSYSDRQDGWIDHAKWSGKSFKNFIDENGKLAWTKKELVTILRKKLIKTMML